MKWPNKLICLTVSVILIVGCANTRPALNTACLFADGSQKIAPEWVCYTSNNTSERSAIGYAAASITGQSFSDQMAITAAQDKLLRGLWTDLDLALPIYIAQINEHSELDMLTDLPETLEPFKLRMTDSIKAQFNRQLLRDVRVKEKMTTPTGATVVLMAINQSELTELFNQAIQQANQEQPQLWQTILNRYNSTDLAAELINSLEQLPAIAKE